MGSARAPASSTGGATATVPTPEHVVVVVLENKDIDQVLGTGNAPYLDHLAQTGADFTNAHAETHPSQPNYLALFSGSTQGITDDSCLPRFAAPNLATQLQTAGRSFVGYSESLPAPGLHRLPPRRVRPEALALGGVHQPPAGREPALERVACLLRPTAHGRLRHPQPLQRHARLRGQRW